MLLEKEFALVIVPGWMLRLTVHDGVPFLWFRPRPEPFGEASNYRLHERLVRVIFEKLTEFFDIYIAGYLKQVGMSTYGFIGDGILKFGLRRSR